MASSDVVFETVVESLEALRFVVTQFAKRCAYVLDRAILDTHLRPSLIVGATVILTLLTVAVGLIIRKLFSLSHFLFQISAMLMHVSYLGVKETFFAMVRSFPLTRRLIRREREKLKQHLNRKKKAFLQDEKPIHSLPAQGWSSRTVLHHLRERNKRDVPVNEKESKVSGTVYLASSELDTLLCDVYRLFSLTNPLHPDVFPSVRQMEAEVVSVCGSLMNSKNTAKYVCGCMTSGGSESILLAVKVTQ